LIKVEKISLNQMVSQVTGNIANDMAEEKVMISIKNGKYYNLGEVGGVIWDLIEKPILVNQIVNELICKYKVDYAECEHQVVLFLEHLLKEELIDVSVDF
jgi:Coenzyme PQQ synthesis protein D (PqqD)